ncbi:MAG TPA: D-alanyl-D-alanine carboxypeptidase family protein [Candidatus Dormibacteraeota bacterium]|nr:D-alanyl-D-alanine carboxypeptidase family protein [Candidatus Dormibacteraeota bacterium]
MRFFVWLISILFITFGVNYTVYGQANLYLSANNAVLIDQTTGEILYEKDAHEQQPIASITKIMTAIIAIESGKMDEKAKASRRAIYTEGSSIYLEQGEKMLLEDLVYGLMLRSGNDAAVAIGEHVAGSVEGFVYLMNEKASWLGMTNTHFENPHGLDSDNHYSTAYDMALLMKYAMENPKFEKITGATFHQAQTRSYGWGNKNKLLTSLYENCIGGKTGFTKKSGRTLTTVANKDDFHLIAVTLNAPNDWQDHIQMYEWGFNHLLEESTETLGDPVFKPHFYDDVMLALKKISGFY